MPACCYTIWECQPRPKILMQALELLAYTLTHIFLEGRKVKTTKYQKVAITFWPLNPNLHMEKQNIHRTYQIIPYFFSSL